MSDPSANPFEAPTSQPTAPTQFDPNDRGPMPTSVVVAIVATGIFVFFGALQGLGGLVQGGVELLNVLPVVIGVLILAGLAKGHRLARQWGRILVLLAAVFYTIGLLGMVVSFWVIDEVRAEMPQNVPFDLQTMLLLGTVFLALFVACLWTIFFALGTESARRYFGMICPNCHSRRVKAADFFYNRAKCKDCGTKW